MRTLPLWVIEAAADAIIIFIVIFPASIIYGLIETVSRGLYDFGTVITAALCTSTILFFLYKGWTKLTAHLNAIKSNG